MSEKIIDAKDTFCPGPLMELITHMRKSEVGDVLELLSTDEGSANDVPEWVDKVGHEMLGTEKIDDVWHLKIKKTK